MKHDPRTFRWPVLSVLVLATLAGCKTAAGAPLADWTYDPAATGRPTSPRPFSPPRIVSTDAEWPTPKGAVKLTFVTEIGDYVGEDAVHWNWPRHIRITLAEATTVKLPSVDCMPGPPGNKVENGVPVRPKGKDGVTPTGLVACFFSTSEGTPYAFDVDGDGAVTGGVPGGPTR